MSQPFNREDCEEDYADWLMATEPERVPNKDALIKLTEIGYRFDEFCEYMEAK